MAEKARTGNLTPEIVIDLLQEDLANLERVNIPTWAGQITWNGQPTVIILIQGVRLVEKADGTASLVPDDPIRDVDALARGLQEIAPPEVRGKTADEILAAASVPPDVEDVS